MPSYRYFAADILTGAVLAELPLYGVWCSRKMSEAGEMTATFKLGTGMYDDQSLLDATETGKACLYVERNGTIVWGGPIWTRTWQEESKTMNLTGQTFESVFARVALETDVV